MSQVTTPSLGMRRWHFSLAWRRLLPLWQEPRKVLVSRTPSDCSPVVLGCAGDSSEVHAVAKRKTLRTSDSSWSVTTHQHFSHVGLTSHCRCQQCVQLHQLCQNSRDTATVYPYVARPPQTEERQTKFHHWTFCMASKWIAPHHLKSRSTQHSCFSPRCAATSARCAASHPRLRRRKKIGPFGSRPTLSRRPSEHSPCHPNQVRTRRRRHRQAESL